MSRFVVVSFAFLGWAFYELSGGADFQPPERPTPIAKAQPATRNAEPTQIAAVSPQPEKPILSKRIKRTFPTPQEQRAQQQALAKEAAAARRDVLSRGLAGGLELFQPQISTAGITVASLADTDVQLVSLTEPAPTTPVVENATYESPQPDLRKVTGTRVNMRNGPGTTYPIIQRLTLGNEVEVLSDSGTGWLRLRSIDQQHVGWIAASLISKKSQ